VNRRGAAGSSVRDAPGTARLRADRDRSAGRHLRPFRLRRHPPQGTEVRCPRHDAEGVQTGLMSRPIYLDYNATTPVEHAVLTAMLPFLEREFGNPSSRHACGADAEAAVEHARGQVAAYSAVRRPASSSPRAAARPTVSRSRVSRSPACVIARTAARVRAVSTSSPARSSTPRFCARLPERALRVWPLHRPGRRDGAGRSRGRPPHDRSEHRPDLDHARQQRGRNSTADWGDRHAGARAGESSSTLTPRSPSASYRPPSTSWVSTCSASPVTSCTPRRESALYIRPGTSLDPDQRWRTRTRSARGHRERALHRRPWRGLRAGRRTAERGSGIFGAGIAQPSARRAPIRVTRGRSQRPSRAPPARHAQRQLPRARRRGAPRTYTVDRRLDRFGRSLRSQRPLSRPHRDGHRSRGRPG
jgi:hypothetical protein